MGDIILYCSAKLGEHDERQVMTQGLHVLQMCSLEA